MMIRVVNKSEPTTSFADDYVQSVVANVAPVNEEMTSLELFGVGLPPLHNMPRLKSWKN